MKGQRAFDTELTRAMSRRQFLSRVVRASSVAVLASSPLSCGTLRGQIERQRLGDAAPVFHSVEREVVAKIIDGFNPPGTEIRRRLASEDPDYDLVDAYAQFAWAQGEEFLSNIKFLIDFLNVLPTFTRTFSTRHGLPARLQLRNFATEDATRYFLFLRDSELRAMRNIFSGAKFIGTAPIYINEKVAWKVMRYPGPWLSDPARRDADLAASTSYELAKETDDNVAILRRRVVPHSGAADGPGGGARGRRRRPPGPRDRRRGGRVGGGRVVRRRRAGRAHDAAGPDPREGRLPRARRLPPARAAHDAAHLRHRVLGGSSCSAARSPPSPPPW